MINPDVRRILIHGIVGAQTVLHVGESLGRRPGRPTQWRCPKAAAIAKGQHIVGIVARVHGRRKCQLFLVAEIGSQGGFEFGLGERGQKHCRQYGNDGDDHQQLDESEGLERDRLMREIEFVSLHGWRGF
jgi:hypothetical protein